MLGLDIILIVLSQLLHLLVDLYYISQKER